MPGEDYIKNTEPCNLNHKMNEKNQKSKTSFRWVILSLLFIATTINI
jgi:hypothetical protein